MIPVLLLVFLIFTAFAIVRLRDLFAAVMLSGIYSLISAGLFTVMDAVDVAFTEAAVGAGISSVLMVATLAFTSRREKPTTRTRLKVGPLMVVMVTGGLLFYGTLDLPRYGDPDAPIHRHMEPRFLEKSATEVGPPNIVTSVLGSYRGYDTLGETAVIFTAAIGVLLLLTERRGWKHAVKDQDQAVED